MGRFIMTVDSQVKIDLPRHPAKFSDAVIRAAYPFTTPADRVLDPFAGTGRVHLLNGTTVGVELEPEWAAYHPDTLVGDAHHLPFPDADFDVIFTSPCYGNRMADCHNAQDGCKYCAKAGLTDPGDPPGWVSERGGLGGFWCAHCDHTGLSRRNTYKAALGRHPSENSSTVLQWGEKYRTFHRIAWEEATRVLKPGGRFILNVSNHIRDHREVPVMKWHYDVLVHEFGYQHLHMLPVNTPRNRQGENGDARVACEWLLVLRKSD